MRAEIWKRALENVLNKAITDEVECREVSGVLYIFLETPSSLLGERWFKISVQIVRSKAMWASRGSIGAQ